MIKTDETEVIGFENGRVKMDGRCRIRLPRSGFVHLSKSSKYQLARKPVISLTAILPDRMLVFHLFWVDFSQFQAYLRRDITY